MFGGFGGGLINDYLEGSGMGYTRQGEQIGGNVIFADLCKPTSSIASKCPDNFLS